jgi:hypothetical protein
MFFLHCGVEVIAIGSSLASIGTCTSQLYHSNELSCTPNGDRMKNLRPWEVDVSTTLIRAHKPFGVSSLEVRVLDV